MTSKITRAHLRGKPLFDFCKKAKTTTHECGKDDNRIFCYGILGEFADSNAPNDCRQECKNCNAWVWGIDKMENG